jgi:hypothetical protein
MSSDEAGRFMKGEFGLQIHGKCGRNTNFAIAYLMRLSRQSKVIDSGRSMALEIPVTASEDAEKWQSKAVASKAYSPRG